MTEVIDIPKGFKQTKAGLIPEDWDSLHFSDISKINQGLQIPIEKRFLEPFEGAYFYITNEFLKEGSSKKYYIKNPPESVICNELDILMTRTGNTGTVITGVKGAFHNNFFKIKYSSNCERLFIYYYLNSPRIQSLILKLAGTSTIPDLNHGDFYKIPIGLPPLPEQQKIAKILSTWDQSISTTQKLIDELKLRNKGLAQQLLTGKKRLKGFQDKWKAVLLGEIFTEIKETNDGAENHHIMTISSTLGLITQESKFDRIIAGDSLKKYILLQKGDFAYNKGNSKTYPMGCIYQLQKESALVPFVYICFRPSNKVSPDFYSFWFLEHGLDRQLKKIITSGARGDGLLNVSKKDFFNLIAPYPSKEEQTAIASVLSEADKELQLHQQQLDTLKEQKKGLMQKLLTGEIRVKI